MINTARATKTWSDSPQENKFKKDTTQVLSPEETKKALGDKDVGTFLNEITDPNYVDPANQRKSGKSELDKDAFFKLMLAQIKAQSPLQPMESHEMAAHLAQFTSLEQLYNVNDNLAKMSKGQEPMGNYQAVSFIGKSISADASQVIRQKGDTGHEIRFRIPSDAQEGTISVFDSTGKEVRKIRLGALKKGENKFNWNGNLDDGSSARAGEYNLKFTAKGANEKVIPVETKISGKITGINYTNQGPVLLLGSQSVRLSEVRKIEDEASAAASAQADSAHQALSVKAKMKDAQTATALATQGTKASGAAGDKAAAQTPSVLPTSTDAAPASSAAAEQGASGSATQTASQRASQSTSGPQAAPQQAAPQPVAASANEVHEAANEAPGKPAEPELTNNLDEINMSSAGGAGPKTMDLAQLDKGNAKK